MNTIQNEGSKQRIRERFWDVLSGELDVEGAEIAARWWTSMGGREGVVFRQAKSAGAENVCAML